MRLYGIFLADVGRQEWDSMAYDVLATNAVLLFPRLFSVLDHYRYFSQLLIAFRLMAIDLMAVFILILIACSGFFIAFTLSFSRHEYNAAEIAYKIFQILMGFTPAAWEVWTTYNPLGRALLVLFLFTCHFLVVTILVTVLTNSFMAIVSNADQEHQFVFAVNTISMVKNDALFSYVAPSNVLAWFLTPLRWLLPFRNFIKMNRTVIKLTHLPLLFAIFIYEKIFLSGSIYESADQIDRERKRGLPFQDPSQRLRLESIYGVKDQALEEVFRLQPRPDTLRKTIKRMNTRKVINSWIDQQTPPDDGSLANRIDKKPTRFRRAVSATRSAASDPVIATGGLDNATSAKLNDVIFNDGDDGAVNDGDDELNTNYDATSDQTSRPVTSSERDISVFFPMSRIGSTTSIKKGAKVTKLSKDSKIQSRKTHGRNTSNNTIVCDPAMGTESSTFIPSTRPTTNKKSSSGTPGSGLDRKTPKMSVPTKSYPRYSLPNQGMVLNFDTIMSRPRQIKHRRSSLEMGTSQIGLDTGMLGAVPSSFATQMAMATGALKNTIASKQSDDMMGRLMLARMKTLEESFAEVVKEFRVMRTAGNSSDEDNEKRKERRPRKTARKNSDDNNSQRTSH